MSEIGAHQHFNTNIKDYSIDDIFNLLDIQLENLDDQCDLTNSINEKIDKYVSVFTRLNNDAMVQFFQDIRKSLLNEDDAADTSNITESQQLLQDVDTSHDAEQNRNIITNGTDTTNSNLFNSSGGAGNPINRKTITKLLTIDSRFRSNYSDTTSTNYSIVLPYVINNVIELKLSDLELATTFYPINDEFENNYFWIKYNVEEDGAEAWLYFYVYIPSSNYYHANLIDLIQTAFDDYGVPLTITFDLDYDNIGGVGVGTGLITIESSSSVSVSNNVESEVILNFNSRKLTSDVDSDYNSCHFVTDTSIIANYYETDSTIDYNQRFGWIMGFRDYYYSGSTTYITESVLDLVGPKYLFLIVNDLNNSSNVNFFSNSESSMLPDNILARVSMKGYPFNIQSQTDFSIYTEPRFYFGPVTIHRLEIKLIDEFGRTMDLNGTDFAFTLSLTTIYSQTS